MAFEADTRVRCAVAPRSMTEGFNACPLAVGAHVGPGVDYAQTVMHDTSGGRRDDPRYEPARNPFLTDQARRLRGPRPRHLHEGAPGKEQRSGTMRHFIGRMRRLCDAFSKRPEHRRAPVAQA